jgi:hypothetical protein
MRYSRAVYPALLAILLCVVAALAAAVGPADARSSGPTGATATSSRVAGTLSTRVVIKRFKAVGKRVVGHGTVISRYTDAAGATSVSRKQFWLRIRERHARQQQGWSAAQQEPEPLCHVLLLEVGEVDLTLAGLHAILKAFNPAEPIQVRIQARRSGGVLGRLFCDLAQGGGVLSTRSKAVSAARTLTARTKGSTIIRAKATVYAPDRTAGSSAGTTYSANGAAPNAPQAPMQAAECDVLHLILGPVHVDLLGLIVDINKVVLDLKGIPGTLLGDIFCQLSNTPRPPGGASSVAGTMSTRMVVNRFTAVGKRVVGQGTVISRYTDAAGATTVKRKSFRLTIPKRQVAQQQGWSAVQQTPLCQILFLEIGEVDLTLAGLHVIARAFNPDEPIRLQLQARREGGILGRLFCDLAQGGGAVATKRKARLGAQALTTSMSGKTIMRVQAIVYAPNPTTSGGAGTMSSMRGGAAPNAPQAPMQVTECHVLHLILGPVHLDLLGLIADLNKIVVDINAIPGTLLGDIFCLLSSDPKPPPPPPAPPPPPPPPPAPALTS